ncbi:hypothetical protein HDU86_002850 [Geranomyces michiganensis]|nr:hypothetical protein HDU86_002850 [Geranomyces michiganensis]
MLSPRTTTIPTTTTTTTATTTTATCSSTTAVAAASPSSTVAADYFSVSRDCLDSPPPTPYFTPHLPPPTPYFTPRLPPPTPLLLAVNQQHYHVPPPPPPGRMGRPLNDGPPPQAGGRGGGGGEEEPSQAAVVVPMDLDDPADDSPASAAATAANQPPPPPPPLRPLRPLNPSGAATSSLQPVVVPRNLANPYAARPASIAGGMVSPMAISPPQAAAAAAAAAAGRSSSSSSSASSASSSLSSSPPSSGGMRVFKPGHLAGLLRSQPPPPPAAGDDDDDDDDDDKAASSHTHNNGDTSASASASASASRSVLALDMRPFQQYSQHRVLSSVNVSIPTTLLKRPAFTPAKMFGSLSSDHAKQVLKDWTNYANIVVFDSDSTVATDAASPIKLLVAKLQLHARPDTRIGWLPGGFVAFQAAHPDLCDSSPPPKGSEGIGPAANANANGNGNINNKAAVKPMCLSDLAGPLTAPSALGALGAGRPSLLQPTYAAHTSVSNINSSDTLIGGIDIANRALLPRFLREMMESGNVKGQIEEKFAAIEAAEKKRLDCSFRARSRTDPFSVSDALEGGATRNRYNNIWPFNHNRVKLATRNEFATAAAAESSGSGSLSQQQQQPLNMSPNPHNAEAQTLANDYINASHIMSPAGHRRYIATQGPIESTFDDFWRMSWQEKSRVILMLVADADVQSGSQTCHKYWPDPGMSREFGRVRVTHIAERRVPFDDAQEISDSANNAGGGVMLREFVVVVNADEAAARTIWQVQYLGWPDHGVPKHADEMLQVHHLVSKLCAVLDRTYGKDDVGPVVVHCSAGCGRTGAFICIDAVLSALHTLGSLPSVSSLGTPTSPNPSPSSGVQMMSLTGGRDSGGGDGGKPPPQPHPSPQQQLHYAQLQHNLQQQHQQHQHQQGTTSTTTSSSHNNNNVQYHSLFSPSAATQTATRSAPGTPGGASSITFAAAAAAAAMGSPADTWSTVRPILTPNTFAPASSPHDMILAAVHHLRSQRVLMVQSLSQYAFCYEVVARCCAVAGIASASSPPPPPLPLSASSPSSSSSPAPPTSNDADADADDAARESVTRYTRIVRSKAVDETLASFHTLAYHARNPKVNVRLPPLSSPAVGAARNSLFSPPAAATTTTTTTFAEMEEEHRKRERAASLEEMTGGLQRTMKRV